MNKVFMLQVAFDSHHNVLALPGEEDYSSEWNIFLLSLSVVCNQTLVLKYFIA